MIALIAGTGGLPPHLASALMAQGRVPVVCEMRGFPSDIQGEFTRVPFRIETVGTFLQTLTALGVTQVCMAGTIHRPSVDPSAIDAATAPLVPRLMDAMAKGDDGTLREIIAIFGEHSLDVVGAHQVAPELLPMAGVLTAAAPPPMEAAIVAAKAALFEMGERDEGQALLVRGPLVIAREDARGTAAMLQDFAAPVTTDAQTSGARADVFDVLGDALGGVADWLSGDDLNAPVGDDASSSAGTVLIKAPKPNQIMEVDMPLIGPETAKQAAQAGLAGIAIAAGAVMVLDLAQVVAALDAQNMFLWVMPEGTL